jgi:hypothetical protein
MAKLARAAFGVFVCLGISVSSDAAFAASKKLSPAQIAACIRKFNINVGGSENSSWWHPPTPGSCTVQNRNGHLYPEPKCTPGSLNPSIPVATLKSPGFTTQCIRNRATGSSESQKSIVFKWYGLPSNSTCEKDHFVPLEMGGADTLDNIWPQCGPSGATGLNRYFKQKDNVETYLARQVKAGMSQYDAEQAIKADWTQYLGAAGKGPPKAKTRKSTKVRA